MTEPAHHRVAFRGRIETAPWCPVVGDVLLADAAGTAATGPVPELLVVTAEYPPRHADAVALAATVDRQRLRRLVAVGDGATLDVAKQAWLTARDRPELVLVPVGAEPWRAFVPFTSLYEPDGQRVSRTDPALGEARVVLDVRALAERPEPVRHLQRADTAVHAVEVLLSRRTHEWGRALADAALAALRRDAPADDVVAAGLAGEAFASAGLGLAHAAASPLGARAGRTHDTVNVLLAPYVAGYWADRVDWTRVAAGLGTEPTGEAVAHRLGVLARRAGVPPTLDAAGFRWEQVRDAVPAALRSSGMPWLPEPVDEAALTALLHRAWSG